MPRKSAPFLDPSVLRISDSTPIKVTFLNAETGGHFVGFYTFDGGAFRDIRTLFANVGPDTLIANVSSVFLGNRLNGKTPVFFVAENGYDLNKGAEWFNDAAAGRNGFWKFLKPADTDGLFPALEQGEIVWTNAAGETVSKAQEACLGTAHPVLVWQSNNGRVFVFKGRLFHSFGYGLYPDLNPDGERHSVLILEEENVSGVLNFIKGQTDGLNGRPLVSLRLHIGERNFTALTRNRVIGAVLPMPETQEMILSAVLEIPEDFEDTLYLEGLEDQQTIPVGGTTFLIEAKSNRLIIKGEAPTSIYEAILSRVKIRTEATAAAKSPVSVVFKTEKEEITRKGEVNILSENLSSSSLLAGMALPKPVTAESERSAKIFADVLPRQGAETSKNDDLPSFLTEMPAALSTIPAVPKPAATKTALVTGGAHRQGKMIAHVLAAHGYNVIIHCHTAVAEATHLVEELRQTYNIKAAYIRADFSSYDETADLIESASKTYGVIDLLVHQASSFSSEETAAGWEVNTLVNLRAPFVLAQTFAKCLPKGREGSIVVVFEDATAGVFSSYALACAAVKEIIYKGAEAFGTKIRFNGISFIKTKDELPGDEISKAVCFLAESPFISGQILGIGAGTANDKKK